MRKDELPSPRGQEIKVFVCGPTVYDYAHLGHARTYLALDMMIRYLRFRGYRPYVVMNITDIDERIIKKAEETGKKPDQIAAEYEKSFYEDMRALGIETVDRFEPVTDHIPDIIEQIKLLLSKSYAYETETGVYFDVSKSPSYGELSRQSRADLRLRRFELCSTKHHPEDFSLWRKFDEGPVWESPWGLGRPGWHIEDTAISMRYLGSSYDIHAGGVELVFPHHEAEIVQGEALSGKRPIVTYWVHMGMLNVRGLKMSKSLGNMVRIRDVLHKFTPEELRFLFANTHYRRTADFSSGKLLQARRRLKRMREVVTMLGSCSSKSAAGKSDLRLLKDLSRAEASFTSAMDDDLDTPGALRALSNFLETANKRMRRQERFSASTCERVTKTVSALANVIGILAV